MKCSTEALQSFLDGELGPVETKTIRHHLSCCPACRQELSRLRLLWLELEQDEEIEVPLELPFIRQQAIARTRTARQETKGTSGVSLWDAQKLAWQPALAGISKIPGPSQLGFLTKATIRGLPAVIQGVSQVSGMIIGKIRRDRR
ncbi:MAG: zf-HC2 domain-containing protein [Peptococcaceae bacterium]|nr:zf-HC2 domain-containing protein [Peptococcaceae bacterium]